MPRDIVDYSCVIIFFNCVIIDLEPMQKGEIAYRMGLSSRLKTLRAIYNKHWMFLYLLMGAS